MREDPLRGGEVGCYPAFSGLPSRLPDAEEVAKQGSGEADGDHPAATGDEGAMGPVGAAEDCEKEQEEGGGDDGEPEACQKELGLNGEGNQIR